MSLTRVSIEREEDEHHDGAAVDQHLHERQELDGEQDVQPGDAEQRHDQEERGVDGAAHQHDAQRRRR